MSMSESIPKKKLPGGAKTIIAALFVLLIGSGGWLGHALMVNFGLEMAVDRFAYSDGDYSARSFFAKGQRIDLRLQLHDSDESGPVPSLGELAPTGKAENGREIWAYWMPKDFPSSLMSGHLKFIEGFNRSMDFRIKNPELYDQCGERIPQASPKKKDTKTPQ